MSIHRKNTILIHTTPWTDLGNTSLSESNLPDCLFFDTKMYKVPGPLPRAQDWVGRNGE